MIHYNKGENEKALEYYIKSIEIHTLTLPSNHPDITISYDKIGFVIELIELLSFFNKLKVPLK